jgi:hypothetical protein
MLSFGIISFAVGEYALCPTTGLLSDLWASEKDSVEGLLPAACRALVECWGLLEFAVSGFASSDAVAGVELPYPVSSKPISVRPSSGLADLEGAVWRISALSSAPLVTNLSASCSAGRGALVDGAERSLESGCEVSGQTIPSTSAPVIPWLETRLP